LKVYLKTFDITKKNKEDVMKKLSSISMKILVIMFFLCGVFLVSISNHYAQDPTEKEIYGFRKVTKKERAMVVFNKSIDPREKIEGDHMASGISLRNRGGGVINLRGVPKRSTPIKAYLYWDILANSASNTASVSINGVAVVGSLIGQGPVPCWNPPVNSNFVYRAEVPLSLLYIGINGDYKIAGFPSTEGSGMNPWDVLPAQGPFLAEGATLVVFYSNQNSTYNTTYVYDTPVSSQMFLTTFSTTLMGFTAQQSSAKFTMVGADGQVGNGVSASYYCTLETSFFQGIQIAGPPAGTGTPPPGLDVDSDWNGNDVEPLNQLWDTRTHIVPIKRESTSAEVRYNSHGDCLVIVAFFLGV
jgi:hypothetical protein